MEELRSFSNRENLVLIFDEVQCGVGRTGKMFAHQHYGVKPDIMALAKSLGGGIPIGAVLASEKVGTAMDRGDHGTTYGGNPLACAAAMEVLNILEDEKLLEAASIKGKWIREFISEKRTEFPEIIEVRGEGLMVGIVLNINAKEVALEMLKRRVLCNATGNNVIRLVPPLIITEEEINTVLNALFESIRELRN